MEKTDEQHAEDFLAIVDKVARHRVKSDSETLKLNILLDDKIGDRIISLARLESNKFASSDALFEHLIDTLFSEETDCPFTSCLVFGTSTTTSTTHTVRVSLNEQQLCLFFATTAQQFLNAHS